MSAPSPPFTLHVALLAAGASRRFGAENKLLASLDGAPLLEQTLNLWRDAHPALKIFLVTGHEHERVSAHAHGLERVHSLYNPRWEEGMGTSLALGFEAAAQGAQGVFVALADMPWIKPSTINALIEAFLHAPTPALCAPSYQGRRGHPVLFDSTYVEQVRRLGGDEGARSVLSGAAITTVEVDDPGIFADVDLPEHLRLKADASG